MKPADLLNDPEVAWSPYRPTASEPWDEARVAHLHRRAGLGATWGQVVRDRADGPEASIRRILEGDSHGPDGRAADDFDATSAAMEESARRRPSMDRVELLWLFRLIRSRHPLLERMALAWHGHFATGQQKVDDPLMMLNQSAAQRELWRAPFGRLLGRMLVDPAMLAWLDGFDSFKDHPNENLARELLELFALGEGHYTEADIKGVARALTGWRRVRVDGYGSAAELDPSDHDDETISFLGQSGRFGVDDVVRIVVARPAAAVHVAGRLFRTFVADIDEPTRALLDALATVMRSGGDVDVGRGIETVLHSRLFHSAWCRGRRVKSPVDYVVGAIRAAEAFDPGPDLVDLDITLTKMGQHLYYPPNVAGWPGGLTWLRGPTLLARANFAAAFLDDPSSEKRLAGLAARYGLGRPDDWRRAIETLLFGADDRPTPREAGSRFAAIFRERLNQPNAQLS